MSEEYLAAIQLLAQVGSTGSQRLLQSALTAEVHLQRLLVLCVLAQALFCRQQTAQQVLSGLPNSTNLVNACTSGMKTMTTYSYELALAH